MTYWTELLYVWTLVDVLVWIFVMRFITHHYASTGDYISAQQITVCLWYIGVHRLWVYLFKKRLASSSTSDTSRREMPCRYATAATCGAAPGTAGKIGNTDKTKSGKSD